MSGRKEQIEDRLLEHGNWDNEEETRIRKWICTTDTNEKRREASQLVGFLIVDLLGEHCSIYGREAAEQIGSHLDRFEEIMVTTRVGMQGKFYRLARA